MNVTERAIGQVVTSRAGRDRGRSFLIVGVYDDNHVLVADGVLRKMQNPKKKKLRHLTMENAEAEGIREKLSSGEQVLDADVRKSLHRLGYDPKAQE